MSRTMSDGCTAQDACVFATDCPAYNGCWDAVAEDHHRGTCHEWNPFCPLCKRAEPEPEPEPRDTDVQGDR